MILRLYLTSPWQELQSLLSGMLHKAAKERLTIPQVENICAYRGIDFNLQMLLQVALDASTPMLTASLRLDQNCNMRSCCNPFPDCRSKHIPGLTALTGMLCQNRGWRLRDHRSWRRYISMCVCYPLISAMKSTKRRQQLCTAVAVSVRRKLQ